MRDSCVELLFSVGNCRAELSMKMHKFFEVETMFLDKFKLADVVRNYINHDN